MKVGAAGLNAVTAGLRDLAADSMAGVDRALNEDRIRLAVTGLSRAGKTVFITSLIQNLLALGRARDTLPKITARLMQQGVSRLRSVEVLPAGASVLPFFDHVSKLADLASDNPSWPPRTEDLAQISLALEIDRPSSFGRRLGSRRIRLDILDYPGEWLLDLPMLRQSYAEWSAQTLDLMYKAPRRGCSGPFLAFIADLRPADRAEESLLHKGHVLYRDALQACRREHGLRYLQPGRFICPGPSSDAPFMWFFPLEVASGNPKPGSAAALLQERFTAYQQHVRRSFFDTHFSSFDRQIMLVDVLGALYTGQAAFEDTARVIKDLATELQYGGNNVSRALAASVVRGASQLLPSAFGRAGSTAAQLLENRRIEKVVFVATKADHVPALKRDNLLHLVRVLAGGSGLPASIHASVSHRVAASIRSTRDGTGWAGETAVEVVEGKVLGEEKIRPFFVGDVPLNMPSDSFWPLSLAGHRRRASAPGCWRARDRPILATPGSRPRSRPRSRQPGARVPASPPDRDEGHTKPRRCASLSGFTAWPASRPKPARRFRQRSLERRDGDEAGSGRHAATTRAHARALARSVTPGNSRSSTAAASSPPPSNAARMDAASVSLTMNMMQPP